MTFEALNRQLRVARFQRSVFAVTALLLLISNVFLAGSFAQVQSTTVLVPSRISDGMVAVGAVDVRYVEALAKEAVFAFYNVSPQNTDSGRDVVERLSGIRERAAMLEAFDQVAEDIRERRISTTFFLEKIEHDETGLKIAVHGQLTTFIEQHQISREPRVVTLEFVEQASSVRLARMSAEDPRS